MLCLSLFRFRRLCRRNYREPWGSVPVFGALQGALFFPSPGRGLEVAPGDGLSRVAEPLGGGAFLFLFFYSAGERGPRSSCLDVARHFMGALVNASCQQ